MAAVIWPETAENLKAAGYRAACYGSCRSCGARVLWARTPAGKLMPLIEKRVETHVYHGGGKGGVGGGPDLQAALRRLPPGESLERIRAGGGQCRIA